jgi:hypothetical protein
MVLYILTLTFLDSRLGDSIQYIYSHLIRKYLFIILHSSFIFTFVPSKLGT